MAEIVEIGLIIIFRQRAHESLLDVLIDEPHLQLFALVFFVFLEAFGVVLAAVEWPEDFPGLSDFLSLLPRFFCLFALFFKLL